LATPWARVVSDWGHQGLCLRVLGAHFGHIFAHILHAGSARGSPRGANFRNSDLVEVRVHSQRQYLAGFGRCICPLSRSFYVRLCIMPNIVRLYSI
jgi:hypothetical protein